MGAAPGRREDFGVALICALPLEFDAVTLAFDEIWNEDQLPFEKTSNDHNSYALGRLGKHNVVLLLLPEMGKISAASATASLRTSFSGLKLAILCGICGGVPNPFTDDEMLLGDVIISKSLVQYDFGRQYDRRFARKDTVEDNLGRPSKEIRSLIAGFTTRLKRNNLERRIAEILDRVQGKALEEGCWTKYSRPASDQDVLFKPNYLHRHREKSAYGACGCDDSYACEAALHASCEELKCDLDYQLPRRRLEIQAVNGQGPGIKPQQPQIFTGCVGSGDTVMKSAAHRDQVASEHGIIAFEMEGAGVWDEVPCIIVKAVCDYADSHKNKKWQNFAAATAASAAAAVLEKFSSAAATEALKSTNPTAVVSDPAELAVIVPYAENPEFVGRAEILEPVKQLFGHEELNSGTSRRDTRVTLNGIGGVGKTQIALAYSHWFNKKFPDASVFWVHASSIERFRLAFIRIAQECQIPGRDDPKSDVLQLVKNWLEDRQRKRWLLVIDNADDMEVFFSPTNVNQPSQTDIAVGRYIPECSHGSILITTRNKQVGVKLTRGKPPIQVKEMTDGETNELLGSLLQGIDFSPGEASLLSSRLEHLPLALAQAASFILENSLTISEYVRLLDQSDFSLVDRLSEHFETVGRDSETPHALTATWLISFDQIERQQPLAGDILSVISLLDRQAIPRAIVWEYCHTRLLEDAGSTDDHNDNSVGDADADLALTKALGTLQAFSFITKAGENSYNMHRLVQLITHKRMTDRGVIDRFSGDAVTAVAYAFPLGTHQNRELCAKYLPHALAVLDHAGDSPQGPQAKQQATLSQEAGRYLEYRGRYKDAERYQTRSYEVWKAVFGPKHPNTLSAQSSLASIYHRQGRFGEALEIYQRVFQHNQEFMDDRHPELLRGKYNLAHEYIQLHRLDEAEGLCSQAFQGLKKTLGEEHPETLKCMSLLARIFGRQKRPEEALRLYTLQYEISKKVMGSEDLETLAAMHNLASIKLKLRRVDEVEVLAKRVLAMRKRVLGAEHVKTVSSMDLLAQVYYEKRRYWEAGELMEIALEERSKSLGNSHFKTLNTMDLLARTWERLGQTEKATGLMRECAEGRDQTLGPDHPDTISSFEALEDWKDELAKTIRHEDDGSRDDEEDEPLPSGPGEDSESDSSSSRTDEKAGFIGAAESRHSHVSSLNSSEDDDSESDSGIRLGEESQEACRGAR
ncbi:Nephrocystin-3-like protein 3 [Colletotrichum musicola]|uniref:Nephrocystin-3-like protein 3 n=1 Tax=Colletotrichum musicola TaxID=2175873 RepID=A0A8H6J1H3_9PEZI|nr:Nephrocystin-3-like protein 3 [Colletotrichum musicola]